MLYDSMKGTPGRTVTRFGVDILFKVLVSIDARLEGQVGHGMVQLGIRVCALGS
jgi:hypothetical protein